jgi:hypothetical protein
MSHTVYTLYFGKHKHNKKYDSDIMKKIHGFFIVVRKVARNQLHAYTHVDEKIVKVLHKKLYNMFPSLKTEMGPSLDIVSGEINYDRYMFRFKNKADEAHFILYASDGVEVVVKDND